MFLPGYQIPDPNIFSIRILNKREVPTKAAFLLLFTVSRTRLSCRLIIDIRSMEQSQRKMYRMQEP
jgi:hypothetical protein